MERHSLWLTYDLELSPSLEILFFFQHKNKPKNQNDTIITSFNVCEWLLIQKDHGVYVIHLYISASSTHIHSCVGLHQV